MELSARRPAYIVPPYSLTGDILSFIRCGLQYRMHGIGNLPSTRPVQMWFGQFVHGVLEESYRRYRESRREEGEPFEPPATSVLNEICELVERRLAAQGLRPRSRDVLRVGRDRAHPAVVHLGPSLFPLIRAAEVRLTGTRRFPDHLLPKGQRVHEADRYEMKGIIDVITHVELTDPRFADNWLVKAVKAHVPVNSVGSFEVIVDYKGMRRPPLNPAKGGDNYAAIYEWQLQTYAELRSLQQDALPVAAGVLLYLNELRPTWTDLAALQAEIKSERTDVVPRSESPAARALQQPVNRRGASEYPSLPLAFRLARTLKVVPISNESQETAATRFDEVVASIECGRFNERSSSRVLTTWPTNTSDEATCVACDWKTVCPEYSTRARLGPPPIPGRD
jgi:hypothetical protein